VEATVDLSKFKVSDWLKVGGGLVFFIAGFLAWWTVDVSGFGSGDATGLGDYFGTVGIAWLIYTAIAVLTVLIVLGIVKLPANVPIHLIFLIASVFALLLVIIRFFSDGYDTGGIDVEDFGVDISRGIGNWLGTLAAIVIVVGCVLAFREAGGSMEDFKNIGSKFSSSSAGASASASTPPPPPPPPPSGSTPPPPPPPTA
jgi:hypothetical protein